MEWSCCQFLQGLPHGLLTASNLENKGPTRAQKCEIKVFKYVFLHLAAATFSSLLSHTLNSSSFSCPSFPETSTHRSLLPVFSQVWLTEVPVASSLQNPADLLYSSQNHLKSLCALLTPSWPLELGREDSIILFLLPSQWSIFLAFVDKITCLQSTYLWSLWFWSLKVLGIDPRALYVLGKHSTT